MATRPYFTITRNSFEKNAGYKSTVHALAELIDNSYEAEAENAAIVLQVDSQSRLQKIAVIDDGKGMNQELLQMAVCEKAGAYLERQDGAGPSSKRKLGKYGVGLPKASISQCNTFSVWSWVSGGISEAYKNGINITDNAWIDSGAEVEESVKDKPPIEWLHAAEIEDSDSGTMVLWEDLDGITWAKARLGQRAGLIPNLEFEVGRVYRKLIDDLEANFIIYTIVIDNSFNIKEKEPVLTNDPLYLEEGQKVPREKINDDKFWPPDDPLFDLVDEDSFNIKLPLRSGEEKEVSVAWRCSQARKNVFALLNKRQAGNLPHGKHANRNVGLSLLREGREISMSMALAVPSEPRERWFGMEVEIPHELDLILGMTNNKQEYTRLEKVLQHDPKDYIENGESSAECIRRIEMEDNDLAICLRIAWKTQDLWKKTKKGHLNMREEHKKITDPGDEGEVEIKEEDIIVDPEGKAEETATSADPLDTPKPTTPEELSTVKTEFENELKKAGVPPAEAEQIAARIVNKGLSYVIAYRSGLGTSFFNVRDVIGVKLIELNTDHVAYPYIKSSIEEIESEDVDELIKRLETSKIIMHLILEAWAKNEASVLIDDEKRKLHRIREDWGRNLEDFILNLPKEKT